MFTKKDREIANQKAMIKNRDKLIEKQVEENRQHKEENKALYEENRDLRFENDELNDSLKEILKLAEGNAYNNEKIVLSKIIELAKTAIQD